jgi:hypothetical protein
MQTAHFLSGLMLFPVECQMKHDPFIPDIELCKLFVKEGEVVATGAGYAILQLRSP